MQTAVQTYSKDEIWDFLKEIHDPEIPVLNIVEMGIARDVEMRDDSITVKITPTYSGCPAMVAIENEIRLKLAVEGIENFEVKKDFSEVWTTDWMTEEAKQKLKNYGIAPPTRRSLGAGGPGKNIENDDVLGTLKSSKKVECPYCGSGKTKLQSEFGSTACKSQYYCDDCEEPFEHFKCI